MKKKIWKRLAVLLAYCMALNGFAIPAVNAEETGKPAGIQSNVPECATNGDAGQEPAKQKAANSDGTETELGETEPSGTESSEVEPSETEPARTETSKAEPGKTERTRQELGKTEPKGENHPLTSEQKPQGNATSQIAAGAAQPVSSVMNKEGENTSGGYDYPDGAYQLDITSGFKMFKVSAPSTALVSAGTITVTMPTTSKTYDRIYLGSKEDEVKEPVISGVENTQGGYDFTFALPNGCLGKSIDFVPGKSDGSWYTKNQYQLTFPAQLTKKEEEGGDSGDGGQGGDSGQDGDSGQGEGSEQGGSTEQVPLPDGNYQTDVTSNQAMFRVTGCVLSIQKQGMTAEITLSGTGYDYLYLGTAAQAASASSDAWIPYVEKEDGSYAYTLPVSALDTPIKVAAHSKKNDKWYDRELTFLSQSMKRLLDDGIYDLPNVISSASMFRVTACTMTAKQGAFSVTVTLSGTGYDYLYLGTGEEAGAKDSSEWISFAEDAEGKYTYTFVIPNLDTPIKVAAHSKKNNSWYDRTLTFSSEGMKKIGNIQSNPGESENPGESSSGSGTDSSNTGSSQTPDTGNENVGQNPPASDSSSGNGSTEDQADADTADTESKYEDDVNGSTTSVNSHTTLADGVYKPDRFSWSGGTGRVSLSCRKITVKDGKAYATIVFSSDSYTYVKANGHKYYGTIANGTSTFVLPVELNRNNRILGLTTKMSASHEIEYQIFVYLAAATQSGSDGNTGISEGLDEEAPEIAGLEYESETKAAHAEYFRMYHYAGGITLLEIDMTKDTARETDTEEADKEKSDPDAEVPDEITEPEAVEEVEELEGEESESADKAEQVSQLYMQDIVKYLIVPEDAEIPAGLDKELIVVELPAENVYLASSGAYSLMDDLSKTDRIAAYGCKKTEWPGSLAALPDKEDEEMIFGGYYTDPDLKLLLKEKTGLALLPSDILPKEETEDIKISDALAEDKNAGEPAEDEETRLEEITSYFATLSIPVIVNRSMDEKTELAQYEWIKVYGALFGCEKEADALYEKALAEQTQE